MHLDAFCVRVLTNTFSCVCVKMFGELAFDADYVAATTDGWRGVHHTEYLGCTVHYIDSGWQLRKLTLAVVEMEGTNCMLAASWIFFVWYTWGSLTHCETEQHTAANLCQRLRQILNDAKLANKVVSISHDSASNMKAGAALLCQSLSTEFKHPSPPASIPCVAHWLQLVIEDARKSCIAVAGAEKQEFMRTHIGSLRDSTGLFPVDRLLPEVCRCCCCCRCGLLMLTVNALPCAASDAASN